MKVVHVGIESRRGRWPLLRGALPLCPGEGRQSADGDDPLTATTLELFHRGVRIASHVRSDARGRHTTVDAHMTPGHRAVLGWDAPRLISSGRRESGRITLPSCSAFCGSADIRNTVTGRAWASCASPRPTGTIVWKRPASGPSRSARLPAAA